MIPTKCIFIPVPFHQQFTFLAASRISTIFYRINSPLIRTPAYHDMGEEYLKLLFWYQIYSVVFDVL